MELSELLEEYQHIGLVTTRPKIAEERDLVLKVMMAIPDAIFHVKQDSDGVKTILASNLYLDLEEDQDVLDNAYESLVHDHLFVIPYPTLVGLETIILTEAVDNPDAARISAEDVVDLSIL